MHALKLALSYWTIARILVRINMHACRYMHVHICMHICMHTCEHTCLHACKHTYEHACKHTWWTLYSQPLSISGIASNLNALTRDFMFYRTNLMVNLHDIFTIWQVVTHETINFKHQLYGNNLHEQGESLWFMMIRVKFIWPIIILQLISTLKHT